MSGDEQAVVATKAVFGGVEESTGRITTADVFPAVAETCMGPGHQVVVAKVLVEVTPEKIQVGDPIRNLSRAAESDGTDSVLPGDKGMIRTTAKSRL